MKKYFLALLAVVPLFAELSFSGEPKIGVQNSILTQVNGTVISVIDLKKKMDVLFHQHYPHLEQSDQARFQFYEASWRHVLSEMIDHQLILADAQDKEVKLTDGEIREALEAKFGPNTMITLDRIGLSYSDAWKMVKDELLVQRMSWWFIHSRALSRVTPQEIRQAFRFYVKENPAYQEWRYRVISVRGDNPQPLIEKVIARLEEGSGSFETLSADLAALDANIQVSSEYAAADADLSASHKEALAMLRSGEFSEPVIQKNRVDGKNIARIFYLSEKIDHPAPEFTTLSPNLKNELTQKAIALESSQYLDKLRKHYGYDEDRLKEQIPDNFHPFSLQ